MDYSHITEIYIQKMSNENNKRIAKNTAFLYIRMLLSIIISLYTSRVVLQVLGEVNYGIYGLVGSVVAMFTFLNTAMSGATSRFLTHEMAIGDKEKLRDTFNSALIIHIGIALLIFVLAETIGLWFLHNKLVIPEGRMFAAEIVYQLSIASMVITITQVPYNAAIIAHEKMDVYAYVELLNVTLKLVIVYILLIGNFDKLILYAILVLCVTTLIAFVYRIYCVKHYEETHIRIIFKPAIIKPMLTFSLWDLYGNMSVTARQQGTNIILNLFFGVVLNAASGIATMVQGIISGFSGNILQAFRPQIIKNYSLGNYAHMESLIKNAIKFALLMLMIISVPLCIELDYIMHLWLGENVPQYAIIFCRILLIMNLFGVINNILTIAIHATGKIKRLSFISGSIALLNLPVIYFIFKYLTEKPEYAYITLMVSAICMIIVELFIIRSLIPSLKSFNIAKNCIYTIFAGIISVLPIVPIYIHCESSFYRVIAITLVYAMTLSTYSYFLLLNKDNRVYVNNLIKKITKRK